VHEFAQEGRRGTGLRLDSLYMAQARGGEGGSAASCPRSVEASTIIAGTTVLTIGSRVRVSPAEGTRPPGGPRAHIREFRDSRRARTSGLSALGPSAGFSFSFVFSFPFPFYF
jgi:hypothetical protein